MLRATLSALNARETGLLYIGSHGRGVLEEARVPTRRYWYRRSQYRIVTLFTYFASQLSLYCALSRSRDIPTDATIFVNTLLPFGAMLWGRRTGRRVIVHVHEVSITPAPLRRLLTSLAARCADQLLYVSRDHLARLPIDGPSAEIIFNPINPLFRDAAEGMRYAPRRSGAFEVVMLASLRGYKGVEEFMALARALRDRADIRFTLVLNAEVAEVAALKDRHFGADNVILYPRTDDPGGFYARADLVLNLARTDQWIETFGLTLVEAMTFGVPVIAPPLGGPAEIITNGLEGFCIDSRESSALKAAVLELADDPDRAMAMSQAARTRAGEFTFDAYATQLRRIIAKLQNQPKRGDHVKSEPNIALVGTVGLPSRYGGFETLAENLVYYHARTGHTATLTVWCSSKDNTEHPNQFESANLRYVGLRANGAQSIPYDSVSLWQAVSSGHDRILLLGVSGALALPLIRLVSRARIVSNIDGIEWKREKWSRLARVVLRTSEWAAVKFSHEVIADNQAIANYVRDAYGRTCHVIAYGGDHAVAQAAEPDRLSSDLPNSYALALCRIEPENNVHMILKAWSQLEDPLVFIGNWSNSPYGRDLKAQYADEANLHLLDPVYEPSALYALRARASVYVHGHSAGGTNPSLVEMMHFGIPVLAHGCVFNRYSTEGKARYFETPEELVREVHALTPSEASVIGADMLEIARRRYTWESVGAAYFALLEQL